MRVLAVIGRLHPSTWDDFERTLYKFVEYEVKKQNSKTDSSQIPNLKSIIDDLLDLPPELLSSIQDMIHGVAKTIPKKNSSSEFDSVRL